MLHRLPELHRHADREHRDERAGQRRREEAGRDPVEDGRDGNRERGEVGAAAGREPARSRLARPGCCERARLGRGDRAMLGAVQAQGAAAEEPGDDQRVVRIPAASSSRLGSATKAKGRSSAASRTRRSRRARDASAADERRHRGRQLHQAADERDPGGRERRAGISPSCSSPFLVANAQ